MLKSARKILALALACSALCWADQEQGLTVTITKNYMVIGAYGGYTKKFYYRAAPDLHEDRYISLQKENEDDAGRIMWALYSEKNGMLDSVIVDEKDEIYSAVGRGEGGIWPPHLKQRLNQHRDDKVVVAPLSIFDEVFKELLRVRHRNAKEDSNELCLAMELEEDRDFFFKKLQSYKPLIQAAKNAGSTYILFSIWGNTDNLNNPDDAKKFFEKMYEAVGVKLPSREELEKHRNVCRSPYDAEKPNKKT